MSAILLGANSENLVKLAIEAIQHHNKAVLIIALDTYFSDMSPLVTNTADSILLLLKNFSLYARMYREVLLKGGAGENEELSKLMGIYFEGDHHARVWRSSSIFNRVRSETSVLRNTHANYVSLPVVELVPVINSFCIEHFSLKIDNERRAFMKMKVRSPCRNWLERGHCHKSFKDGACGKDHLSEKELDVVWYTSRMKLYLQQVAVIQTLDSVLSRSDQTSQRE